jgi:chromosome segregation ATPase
VHELKNELEETRSAYRNRKADVIALQTELNSANENIGNMTRVMNENSTLLERFEIRMKESEAKFSADKVAVDNMSTYVAELENKIDSQQSSINVSGIKNEELMGETQPTTGVKERKWFAFWRNN